MLGAIKLGDRFTGQKYNILRVVAAFALDVNFQSSSKAVQTALREDAHPLAKLSRVALAAALATSPDGKSFVDLLKATLKRSRDQLGEGSDDEAEEDGPNAKRSKVMNRPV
jgi:hypothetical protein